MNEGIELHDSKVISVTRSGADSIVSLQVYVHRSSGRPGVDAGSGWIQRATLTFGGAALVASPTHLPAVISTGFLRAGSAIYHNIIPATGSFAPAVEFSVMLTNAEALTIQASQVAIQLHGDPTFVESFDP